MCSLRDLRRALATLAATSALALVLIPGFTAGASAADPCSRYGDAQPRQLTMKHARNALICLINRERNSHGRGDLHRDDRLQEAARKHSSRMADKNCLSHECGGERSLTGRLQTVGYLVGGLTRWAYGENVGWGQRSRGTPKEIVDAWMHSAGHRANMLSGTFKDIGAGFDHDGSRGYYTADFGLRVG